MSAQRYNESENQNNASNNNDPNSSINCKLERRRRIEDLHEERRLKHELNEYL